MSQADPYFQFPLCALSFCKTIEERLEHIVSYSVIEAGRSFWFALDEDERVEKRGAASLLPPGKDSFDPNDDWHVLARMGGKALNVIVRDYKCNRKRHQALEQFRHGYEGRHGRDVTVRIKTDFLWETKDESGMNYKEFSFLCAIYSCIGANHGPVRIVRESIRARSLGYKSAKIMVTEFHSRTDGLKIPTEWEVRSMVDKLDCLGFFSRCHPSPRQTFFSNKLNAEELRTAVLKRKTYVAEFRAKAKEKDLALSQSIKDKIGNAIIVEETAPIIVEEKQQPLQEPPKIHQDTSNVPPMPLQETTTIIKTPLIEIPAHRNSEKETHAYSAAHVFENQNPKQPDPEPEPPAPTLQEIQAYAATCVKAWSGYAQAFSDEIFIKGVTGDWRTEYMRFAGRQQRYAQMRTANE